MRPSNSECDDGSRAISNCQIPILRLLGSMRYAVTETLSGAVTGRGNGTRVLVHVGEHGFEDREVQDLRALENERL